MSAKKVKRGKIRVLKIGKQTISSFSEILFNSFWYVCIKELEKVLAVFYVEIITYLEEGRLSLARLAGRSIGGHFLILLGLFVLAFLALLAFLLWRVMKQVAEDVEKEQNASSIQVGEDRLGIYIISIYYLPNQ